jgi:putative NIF3 family GTP cyclohydrolase 1 type 2
MDIKIRNVLDVLTAPVKPMERTVDKLEYGSPEATVTGIAVTFLATQEVLEKAERLGANLIITHEGIFYSHWDKREMLRSDSVYREKLRLIEGSNMAIFRFHDHIHRYMPDGITASLLQALEWQDYEVLNEKAASVLEIPAMSLEEIIIYIKKRLGIQYVRFVGEPAMSCRRIGLFVGYRGGGEVVIPLFEKESLDLAIYGEGPEWETPEYVRDTVRQGKQRALILLGHAESEAPGMECLARRMREKFPGIPVHFIPQKPIFSIL